MEPPNFEDLLNEMMVPPDRPRYVVRDMHHALQPQPPIEWIIENLFSAGSLNLIVGEAASKKTWLMLDAAVCVALGVPWLGFATRQSPVLVVDEESNDRRLAHRLTRVARGHGAGEETPLRYVTLAAFDFRQPADVTALYMLILEKETRLVIIDALADVMPGGDENSVKDVQPLFLSLRRVADMTQSAIVMIHHSNKAGAYRGSTAIKAAADLLLNVSSSPKTPRITCQTEKARDSEPVDFAATFSYTAECVTIASAEFGTTDKAVKIKPAQVVILRFLVGNGASTIREIDTAAQEYTIETVRSEVYALVRDGRCMRTNSVEGHGRGIEAVYDLTDKGRSDLVQFAAEKGLIE
jgi:hypothetical protein